jgi:hypothetical protein
MAKVIEFYVPKNFRKPLRTAAQPQLGGLRGWLLDPSRTTQVRTAMLSMYSKTLESEWACMLLAVWCKSLFWTNSQVEVSTSLERSKAA